jgi:hypothetical protein
VEYLIYFGDGAFDGLECLEGMLLEHIQRPVDPFFGLGIDEIVVGPGGVGEEKSRPNQTCDN